MIRVGFVGVPGSGKTSTSRALAARCRTIEKLRSVELVPEYARRYIIKYGIDGLWDQIKILEKQVEWEDSIPSDKTDLLITDCPIHLGFAYCLDVERKSAKDIMLINDIFKKMNKLNSPPRYDVIFQLGLDHKPVDDGVRAPHQFQDEWRQEMDEKIRSVFRIFQPKQFVRILHPGINQRVDFCIDAIKQMFE